MIMYEHAKDSLGRCLNHGGLLKRFYELFHKYPEVAEKFRNRDMGIQDGALRNGINLAIMFAEGNPIGKNGIHRIRKSHCRDELDIKPYMYPLWLDSFIEAVSEIDPNFDDEIEREWRSLLQKTIDYIVEGYECDDGCVAS